MTDSADIATPAPPETKITSSTAKDKQYQQTQKQLDEIAATIRDSQALTSGKLSLNVLKEQYSTAAGDSSSSNQFIDGIDCLMEEYESIRTIRGDGNCYYRAFLYSLCEQILEQQQKSSSSLIGTQMRDFICNSLEEVINIGGYDETAIEIFHDSIVELMNNCNLNGNKHNSNSKYATAEETEKLTLEKLHVQLNEENSVSDYCTWYLRVLTATYLKRDPARFLPYLEDPDDSSICHDIVSFCSSQVEPMNKECTMVQVLALVEAFQNTSMVVNGNPNILKVKIEYLDGREIRTVQNQLQRKIKQHTFGPDNASITLSLLYRPGHYDILYPKKK